MLIISEYNPHLESEDSERPNSQDPNSEDITRDSPGGGQLGIVFESRDDKRIPSVVSYRGRVKSIKDALLLFEAARLEIIPTVNRRLTTIEKAKYIQSNTVFIWNETQCGVKRWTDGKIWSPSKVHHGLFLIYKHLTKEGDINDGLVKQSMSVLTKQNQKLHLICYYKQGGEDTICPSEDPRLMNLKLPSTIYPENILPPESNNDIPENNRMPSSTESSSSHVSRLPKPEANNKPARIEGLPALLRGGVIQTPPPKSIHTIAQPKFEIADASLPAHPLVHNVFPYRAAIPYSPKISENTQSQNPPVQYQLPPPPPPQPSHYRLDTDHSDSQTLSVLDKGFS
ncbi:uncharacterized protein CANTADRAFT_21474 [Suhomyces tanzawaensis NRRL Y-17324]|uniref:cAMP-independent regulatory protein pac2 n=1 Tax=Suhomyces tanzawaensis NRRL Y-17324 TaxID=984487 RepID=A0A1E4SL43_9ASCO|nr:uncharacterized protein CANTADRAFT_21474 [Suhomyces tanzawaensis NRRL Y-17324]ODV80226.1 hypothetical protein CANTADRAFT_21474 [Suhomyces tanzawaensis NRRL Y-17324]